MVNRTDLIKFFYELMKSDIEIKDIVPNGLQVEGKEKINSMAFAVSATLPVIEEAARQKADALFVHHGFFWPNDPKNIVGSYKKKLQILFDAGINLFAYHLPLDILPHYGNNDTVLNMLAQKYQVESRQSFADIGFRINFKTPIAIESFFDRVDSCYRRKGVHINPGGLTFTDSIVLISGQGTSYSSKIAAHNLMVAQGIGSDSDRKITSFITGEASEWVYSLATDYGFTYSAMGHNNSEEIGPRAVMQLVKDTFSLETFFIEEDNPF